MKKLRTIRRRWLLFLLGFLGLSSCEYPCLYGPEEPMYGYPEPPYVEDSIPQNL